MEGVRRASRRDESVASSYRVAHRKYEADQPWVGRVVVNPSDRVGVAEIVRREVDNRQVELALRRPRHDRLKAIGRRAVVSLVQLVRPIARATPRSWHAARDLDASRVCARPWADPGDRLKMQAADAVPRAPWRSCNAGPSRWPAARLLGAADGADGTRRFRRTASAAACLRRPRVGAHCIEPPHLLRVSEIVHLAALEPPLPAVPPPAPRAHVRLLPRPQRRKRRERARARVGSVQVGEVGMVER